MHFANALYLLVTCLLSVRLSASIRVDWNTNKGPIIPPTPRTTVRPQPPYREPAPVWEDQSDDIPNPNPYVYVLPPPSRPRPATNNYLTADRRPVTQSNYYQYNNQNNYGSLIPPAPGAANFYQNGQTVAGLSPKYVPNVGFRYFAIVPNGNGNANGNGKTLSSAPPANGLTTSGGYDKLQGKYNAKTKKHKAYEKVKYVPPNYYPFYEFALPAAAPYRSIFDQQALVSTQQQLPAPSIAVPFRAANQQQQQQQQQPTTSPIDTEITSIDFDGQQLELLMPPKTAAIATFEIYGEKSLKDESSSRTTSNIGNEIPTDQHEESKQQSKHKINKIVV